MRKLNHRWPKAVPIPRPPTPPHSIHNVQNIKQILMSQKNIQFTRQRNSQPPASDTSSLTSEASTSIMSSASPAVDNEPADAIEPNAEFPPPPPEFLEDLRAFRKQEEIERPSPSPILPRSHSSPATFRFPKPLDCAARNDSSFNGNGSLNSSITETTESSCSPSVSPVASPLPSPSHSSIDTSSTSSFAIHDQAKVRFIFPVAGQAVPPSGQESRKTFGATTHQRLIPGARNVTLAPIHPASREREPIYQRLAGITVPAGYASLPRPSSSGSLVRPPDYRTAMQRLSISRCNQPLGQKTAIVAPVRTIQPLKTLTQTVPPSDRLSHPSLPLPTETTIVSRSHNRRSSISCGEANGCSRTELSSAALPIRRLAGVRSKKKRVSFSDQVELVAHSEDMRPEEHLPNPVLERVLGKAFLNSKNIQNG